MVLGQRRLGNHLVVVCRCGNVDDHPFIVGIRSLTEFQAIVNDWRTDGAIGSPRELEGVVCPFVRKVEHSGVGKAYNEEEIRLMKHFGWNCICLFYGEIANVCQS